MALNQNPLVVEMGGGGKDVEMGDMGPEVTAEQKPRGDGPHGSAMEVEVEPAPGSALIQVLNSLELADDDHQGVLDLLSAGGISIAIQRRIRALRKNQAEIMNIEAQFFKDMHKLEMEYEKKYMELYDQRQEIVVGLREPTEEEGNFQLGILPTLPENSNPSLWPENKNVKGVPMFWSTVLQSAIPISALVEDSDVPILQHLTDIRCENTTEPLGFKLSFHFSPNEYFTNSVLTKTYEMTNEPNPENPLTYEGPEIIGCMGCSIDWNPDKDTTKAVIERRQKHKRTGTIRTISKTERKDSFFHFFNPPTPSLVDPVPEDEADDLVDALNADFEIGEAFRERIIPRAILYYTGEALEDDSEDETDSEEEDDDDEGNQSESGDEIAEQGDQA